MCYYKQQKQVCLLSKSEAKDCEVTAFNSMHMWMDKNELP